MSSETFSVERCRRDDELEIVATLQELLQVAQQEIDVETPLVRLVDDDRVVSGERSIALRLREQDTVRHQLDVSVRARVVGKSDFVADRLADVRTDLLCHPRSDGTRGDAPWLRVTDLAAHAAAGVETNLRQLRRFS